MIFIKQEMLESGSIITVNMLQQYTVDILLKYCEISASLWDSFRAALKLSSNGCSVLSSLGVFSYGRLVFAILVTEVEPILRIIRLIFSNGKFLWKI